MIYIGEFVGRGWLVWVIIELEVETATGLISLQLKEERELELLEILWVVVWKELIGIWW